MASLKESMADCKPCRCRCIDGFAALLYFCIILGSGVIIAVLQLDQKINHGTCVVINFNSSIVMNVPENVNTLVCKWFEYASIGFIVIAVCFMITNWAFGFSAIIGWWVVQLVVGAVANMISLMIGVVLTTMLLIFCGQLYTATNEESCIAAVANYHKLLKPITDPSTVVEVAFDHRVVAVAAAWFVFLGWLLILFLSLLQTCTRCYQVQVAHLERTAENVRESLRIEEQQHQRHRFTRRLAYPSGPPPTYSTAVRSPSPHEYNEDEPLILL